MRNIFFSILTIVLILSSCSQKKVSTNRAILFYDSIGYQLNLNKPEQQSFIDTLTAALLLLKDDPAIKIDTRNLQKQFRIAREKNNQRYANIQTLTEIDNDLAYKKKVLEYIEVFNQAFEDVFPAAIEILGEAGNDRFAKATSILMPKLQLIKEKELEMKSLQVAIKEKYKRPESGMEKTEPDFEYIKLKDFKFTPIKIADGSTIKLLSYSGGEQISNDGIYYKQFIGINDLNGDTLRILSLAVIQELDMEKDISTAIFTADLPIRDEMTPGDKEYIIFNKNQAELEKGNYKTVFGILKFKE